MTSPDASTRSAPDFDAVVVGAGFAGLYMLHRLRELGLHGARCSSRRRRRRHLVLEPLSRRPLRRREHRLPYSFSQELLAGLGVDGALRDPARDPALPRTTSPTGSTCAATSRSSTPVTAAVYDDDGEHVDARHRPRRARDGAVLRLAIGNLSSIKRPDFAGLDDFAGRVLPHRRVAARGRRLRRPAGRRSSAPARPASRRSRRSRGRRSTSTCSSGRPTTRCRRVNRPLDPAEVKRGDRRRTPSDGAQREQSDPGVPQHAADAAARSTSTARASAARIYEDGWAEGGIGSLSAVHRRVHERRTRTRSRQEFVAREDPRDRARPGGGRAAVARGYYIGMQAAPASTSTTSRRSTATTSTLVDMRGDADRERSRRAGIAHGRAPSTSSTRSCSRPASTP